MTLGVRTIRFARADSNSLPVIAGTELVGRVRLDEQPDPAGQIIRRGRVWEYILADGTLSGLTSSDSRQDLERQIVLFHLGTVPSDDAGNAKASGDAPPFKMAM